MSISNWKKIVQLSIQKQLTISVMESCTGGFIINEITNISGASNILTEGYVTYCNEAKIKLGVPAKTIDQYSVYSKEVAEEMAKAAQINANSSIAIGITGLLGRLDPSNPHVLKSNHVWYAIVSQKHPTIVKEIDVPDISNRRRQKEIVAKDISLTLLELIEK